jgi:hypothetical protein
VPNQGLAALVAWVSLARVENLERPDPVSDISQPIGIGEEEIRSLVRSRPPSKAYREDRFIQLNSTTGANFLK